MADITPINPSNNLPEEDPLELLLDEVSDEDFGATRIDDTTKAVLKEWSAQDFASIYTRFRPHLERHARRFLRNQSQVDEVVQDAFLYLMVTLPELDSELGVLRFLKWKTRLLCLDVIRASGRAQISDIDAHPEFEATNTDVSAEIEHAEDAAIVRLALSKLNPRHREVLIASMYEEKTSAEIAAQVGLTENATNQLIFRARSAFKKALLGDDVDTSGMSVSKILSVAARKAAFEAKKVGAQAMVFVLFLILGIGAVVNFTSRPNNQIQAGPAQSPSSQTPSTASSQAPTAEAIAPAPGQTSGQNGEVVQNQAPTPLPTQNVAQTLATSPSPAASPAASANPFSKNALTSLYAPAPDIAYVSKAEVKLTADFRQDYMVSASTGAFADFSFDADADKPFTEVKFTITVDDKQYIVYASQAETIKAVDKAGNQRFVYFSSMKYFVDSKGKVWDQAEVAKGTVRLEMIVDNQTRQVVGSGLNILPTN